MLNQTQPKSKVKYMFKLSLDDHLLFEKNDRLFAILLFTLPLLQWFSILGLFGGLMLSVTHIYHSFMRQHTQAIKTVSLKIFNHVVKKLKPYCLGSSSN